MAIDLERLLQCNEDKQTPLQMNKQESITGHTWNVMHNYLVPHQLGSQCASETNALQRENQVRKGRRTGTNAGRQAGRQGGAGGRAGG